MTISGFRGVPCGVGLDGAAEGNAGNVREQVRASGFKPRILFSSLLLSSLELSDTHFTFLRSTS